MTIYSGARGDGLVLVMTVQTAASIWTNSLRVRTAGLTPFEFDYFRVVTLESSPNSVVRFDNIDVGVDDPSLTLYTHNNANGLVRRNSVAQTFLSARKKRHSQTGMSALH